jgi:hypothetical protein
MARAPLDRLDGALHEAGAGSVQRVLEGLRPRPTEEPKAETRTGRPRSGRGTQEGRRAPAFRARAPSCWTLSLRAILNPKEQRGQGTAGPRSSQRDSLGFAVLSYQCAGPLRPAPLQSLTGTGGLKAARFFLRTSRAALRKGPGLRLGQVDRINKPKRLSCRTTSIGRGCAVCTIADTQSLTIPSWCVC